MSIVKKLGEIAVLSKISTFLKELAYPDFLFDKVLTCFAHVIAQDVG